jgi:hypothetical protein
MALRSPGYGSLLLVIGLVFATGCDDARNVTTATAPSGAIATGTGIQSAISVEPAALRPEFLPDLSCRSNRPFGTRVTIVIDGRNDVSLHRLRFRFTDRFGVTAFPNQILTGVFPMTQPPVSIPSSSPIPIPGLAPLPPEGLFIPFGASRALPFFVSFGCGPFSQGTLFVMFDAKFGPAPMQSSELRVRVSE